MSCLTSLEIITKSPTEILLVGMDFTNQLLDSDSLISESVVFSPDEITVTDELIVGSSVTFKIAGGTSGQNYEVSVTVTTLLGETLVGIGKLKVRD